MEIEAHLAEACRERNVAPSSAASRDAADEPSAGVVRVVLRASRDGASLPAVNAEGEHGVARKGCPIKIEATGSAGVVVQPDMALYLRRDAGHEDGQESDNSGGVHFDWRKNWLVSW